MRCQVEPGAASAGDPYPERSRSSGYIVTAEKDTDWCEKGYRFAVVGQGGAHAAILRSHAIPSIT